MKKETPGSARFPWRIFLYGIIVLYLIGDLYWLHGPLRQKIDSRKPYSKYSRERALEHGWVATVNGEPVTQRQLDRAVGLYFFRRGKSASAASDLDLRLGRLSVMRELVQDVLVRQHSRADKFVADPKRIEAHIRNFESQFPDSEEMEKRSQAQGLDPEIRRKLLTAGITGQLWLEQRVSPATEITEEEARTWFEENREEGEGFGAPEVVRARQLFLSTVEKDTPEREKLIRDLHRQLVAGEATFEALAAKHSEDERSKHAGGDLNWFSAERVPQDFSDAVFGLGVGELSAPFRTSIGWHVVELTERKPGRELSFEELKPEILARMNSAYRRHAVNVFLEKLETASAIEIFPEILYGERPEKPEPATE